MPEAPIPADEQARLAALRSACILDTAEEDEFDGLTRIAAAVCNAPVSLISLVDSKRQWFKSRFGFDLRETPRSVSFCAHAILQPDPLIVPDAGADERFSDSPLLDGDPPIRFYGGVPLHAKSGHRLGTLCVIDSEPRTLTEHQVGLLTLLARHAEVFIEMRRQIAEISEIAEPGKGAAGSLRSGLNLTAEGIRLLKGFVTICSHCRNVKDPASTWVPLEKLISSSSLQFSHSICPACQQERYADVFGERSASRR